MPQIDDIRYASEIGKSKPQKGKGPAYVYLACPDCGKERWIETRRNKPVSTRCPRCSCFKRAIKGETHWNWKGGKKQERGYLSIHLEPDDFFYPMADKSGYVREHRLVMAKHLGRCLQSWEIVHHKGIRYKGNENKSDNLIDNLELSCSISEHSFNHSKGYRDGYQKGLLDGKDKQIQELKALMVEQTKQIKLLQWQIKERV